jgi:hypothetical protein
MIVFIPSPERVISTGIQLLLHILLILYTLTLIFIKLNSSFFCPGQYATGCLKSSSRKISYYIDGVQSPPNLPFVMVDSKYFFIKGAQILAARVARATKFCRVAPNICRPSVWNLLHVTLLIPRIFRWLQYFWEFCGTLVFTILLSKSFAQL